MRTCLVVFLAALPLAALGTVQPLSRYSRQSWHTENGLPQNTVHAVLQTQDGYLWLATEGGLARFDGLAFRVYDAQNTPELKSNNMRCLVEDREHTLWIGSADGLLRLRGGKFSHFSTQQGLPAGSIWSLYQDRSGRLWAITSEGAASYEAGRFQRAPSFEGSRMLVEDAAGFMWAATREGLKRLNGVRETPAANVQALLADRSGGLWIGTPAGLIFEKDGSSHTYTQRDGLPGNRISALYQDRQNNVWISTDLGLARFANNKIERFSSSDSSPSGSVLSMYQDREGSLWLGTEGDGLQVLRDERFVTFAAKEGLSSDLTRCVFQGRDGSIWIGTDNGLNRLQNKITTTITTQDGLSSNVILALAEDESGNLLVGTPDGLNVLRYGKVQVYTSADGLTDDFVRSLYRDSDGSIWIGTRRGLTHWANGTFKTYTQTDGLGSDFVGALLRDSRGSLWIGTLHGLTVLKGEKFKTYTVGDGLSSNIITALHEDSHGVLWVGTQDGGLNRFESGRIRPYAPIAGLPVVIYGILEDAQGQIWIASKTGIFRAGEKTVAQYGATDGLRVSECSEGGHPSVWKTRDGSLWFSTVKGAAVVDPAHTSLNLLPPPVVIEQVSVDGQAVESAGDTLDIPPGRSRLSFEYAGLSFVTPQKIRFRYRLEGFDHDWIDAGTRRTAYYTNISPGTYRFHVLASNSDGLWNETGAWQSLRLRPHFYQTMWFYLSLFVAALLVGYAVYRWRVKQVEMQFQAVLAERNRIAREIHDTLAQGFVAVSVQLELVSRLLAISTESAQEVLQQTSHMVRDGLAEARRSIWQLRSQDSNQGDLASRLSKMATQATATAAVTVRFQVVGPYRQFPEKVENELLKICQEAVTNVVRHAGAKQIAIDLQYEAKKLTMTVADDGRGFTGATNSSGPDGHFGLQGMRERAQQIGAVLKVTSAPDEGTRVCVETVIH